MWEKRINAEKTETYSEAALAGIREAANEAASWKSRTAINVFFAQHPASKSGPHLTDLEEHSLMVLLNSADHAAVVEHPRLEPEGSVKPGLLVRLLFAGANKLRERGFVDLIKNQDTQIDFDSVSTGLGKILAAYKNALKNVKAAGGATEKLAGGKMRHNIESIEHDFDSIMRLASSPNFLQYIEERMQAVSRKKG